MVDNFPDIKYLYLGGCINEALLNLSLTLEYLGYNLQIYNLIQYSKLP